MIGIDINGGNVKIRNHTGSDIEIINSSRPGVNKIVSPGQTLSLGHQQKSEINIKHGGEVSRGEAEPEPEVINNPHGSIPAILTPNEMPPEFYAEAAEYCHEANREYCEAIGDVTQTPWEVAPDWQKESAIAGVQAIWANPETTPEESHLGWLEKKMEDGWRYGEVKDVGAKTHPCMMEYVQLPDMQRAKDTIFGCVARISMGIEVPEYLDVAYKAIDLPQPDELTASEGAEGDSQAPLLPDSNADVVVTGGSDADEPQQEAASS